MIKTIEELAHLELMEEKNRKLARKNAAEKRKRVREEKAEAKALAQAKADDISNKRLREIRIRAEHHRLEKEKAEREANALDDQEDRIDMIADWLSTHSYTDPNFETQVSRLHAVEVKIRQLTEPRTTLRLGAEPFNTLPLTHRQ